MRTFVSLSLEHVQLPRYLRLAPLSFPQLFVYFFLPSIVSISTLSIFFLYSHCVKAAWLA